MKEVVASKILLERELYRPLTVAGRRFIASWEVAGGQMSAWERLGHLANLEAVLSRHYARVVMVMDGRRPTKDATIAEAALSLQHADSLHNRAKRQADLILRSIERELAAALANMSTGAEAPDDGMGQKSLETKDEKPPLQWFEKFKRAAAAAMRKLNAKLGLVANAETNPAAEEARRLIAENEARVTNGSVLKRWISLMDGRERPTHHAAHETYQTPITADEPFVVGGFEMMAPGDASRNAPLKEIINCFPGSTKVSGRIKRATRHWYDGEFVEIRTSLGHTLAGTPNHPILTPIGWVAIGDINKGGNVICCGVNDRDKLLAADRPNIDDGEPMIEKVFDTLAVLGGSQRLGNLAVDFHGDVPAHDVDIVGSDSALKHGINAASIEEIGKFLLSLPFLGSGSLLTNSLRMRFSVGSKVPATTNVGFSRNGLFCGGASRGESEDVGLGAAAHGQPAFGQNQRDLIARDAEPAGHSQDRNAFSIKAPNGGIECAVISVRRYWFSGHVYNLECEDGIYSANGVVVHNCRCGVSYTLLNPDGTESPIAHMPHGTVRPYRKIKPDPQLLRPTSVVTLNGRTRARVVLKDGATIATMTQVTPSTITVSVGGREAARAIVSNGRVSRVTVDPSFRSQGIEDLIRRSVTHSAGRKPESVR